LVLGEGSNVLCRDNGYEGLVVINKILGYDEQVINDSHVLLKIGAGENLDSIIERTIKDGFWGLENLSSIPGSIGATPVQNVGAYGVEVSELIESVEAVHKNTFEKKVFLNSDCKFGYRDSFFKSEKGKEWCVVSVTYKLSRCSKPVLHYSDLKPLQEFSDSTQEQIRNHVIEIRAKKFPNWKTVGTAGSFFKNPIITKVEYLNLVQQYPELPGHEVESGAVKVSLGWILDKLCELKGFRIGSVRLFEKQALVLVVDGEASATEVEDFVEKIKVIVKKKTGIEIEREVLTV
jgi:UDP-N-acetylmuramate dehydrogenase